MASFLFAHPNFPAQFRALATTLGASSSHSVRFLTKNPRLDWEIPGVEKLVYKPQMVNHHEDSNPFLMSSEVYIHTAHAVFKRCLDLRNTGYSPDVIISHSGWGLTLFLRDLFPNAKMIGVFEWFFDSLGEAFKGNVHDPDVGVDLGLQDAFMGRIMNGSILQDLVTSDVCVCPTKWQASQFPQEFSKQMHIIHEGIDTEFFKPSFGSIDADRLRDELSLPDNTRILTYTTRAFEPMRGFPSFMRAASIAIKELTDLHVVIVGDDDRVCYSKSRSDGISYREYMMRELSDSVDWSRIHFLPMRNYGDYASLLRASDCHVYLTKPYVLSWSFLEVLSCATPVVASSSPPVQDIVGSDNTFCLQADFWNPKMIAEAILNVLDNPTLARQRSLFASELVLNKYSVKDSLYAWNNLLKAVLFS